MDVTGERYGRLVAVKFVGMSASKKTVWQFACDCGKNAEIVLGNVRYGGTASCGCRLIAARAINSAKYVATIRRNMLAGRTARTMYSESEFEDDQ